MASINNPNQIDPNKPEPTQLPSAPQAPKSANAQAAPQGTSSGRFTNINQYIKANQNFNKEGGGLGGKMYGNLEGQQQGIQQNFGNAQNQFQQQANAGRTQYDENLVNQATQNAAQFAQDPNNINSFAKLRDATYGGPQAIQGLSQYQNQAQQFGQTAAMGQTEGGRQALLGKLYGSPKYNQGQQGLDNLLLQSNPNQLNKLQSASQLASGLNQNIKQGASAAEQMAQQYGQEAADTSAKTKQALGGAITGFDTQAQDAVKQAEAKRQQDFQQAKADLARGKITKAEAQQLGISAPVEMFGDTDASQFIQQAQTPLTQQQAINKDQLAQIQGLGKLAGGPLEGQAGAVLQNWQGVNADQVGNAGPAYSFDQQGFQNAVGGSREARRQAAYNSALGGLQGQYESLGLGGKNDWAKQYSPEDTNTMLKNLQSLYTASQTGDIGQLGQAGGILGGNVTSNYYNSHQSLQDYGQKYAQQAAALQHLMQTGGSDLVGPGRMLEIE